MINSQKQRGFTLIELIAVIVLSGLVAVIVSRVIAAQLATAYTSTAIINSEAQLRVALGRMTREVVNIDAIANLSNTSTATQLVFVDNYGTTITYSLSGTSLMRNSDVLADGVQSLGFTYYNKSGVAIAPPPTSATVYINIAVVAALRNTNLSANTTVFLRNS